MSKSIIERFLDSMEEAPDPVNKEEFAGAIYNHMIEVGVPIEEADEWLFDFCYLSEGRPRPSADIPFDMIRNDPEYGDQVDRTDNNKAKKRKESSDERFGTEPVESKNLATIGYDTKNSVMEISFQNGAVYRYLNIPENIFSGLKASTSKGRFFDKYVRQNPEYKYARVESVSLDPKETVVEYTEVDEDMVAPKLKRGYADPADLTDKDVEDMGFIPRKDSDKPSGSADEAPEGKGWK